MLNVLRFNLTVPTPFHFINRFFKCAGLSSTASASFASAEEKEVVYYAHYLTELALPSYEMLQFPNSVIAAASVSVALERFGKEATPRALLRHSQFSSQDIGTCAEALKALVRRAPTASLKAVYNKYSSDKFGAVAKMAEGDDFDAMDA